MTDPLAPGSSAPDFTLPRDGGGNATLSALRGHPVVVYFYPEDNTPSCTKEAIGFSEAAAEFAALNATVIGISKDSVAKHDKFIAKHGLKLILASDVDGGVIEGWGSWVEKSMYGKTYMGIDRSTFLIDAAGTCVRAWRKVKVAGHVGEVLAALRAL